MELLTSEVTEDFETWQQSLVVEHTRFWRSLWISLVLTTGLAMLVLLLPVDYPWKFAASLATFFPLLFYWGCRDLLANASNSRLLGALLILAASFLNLALGFGAPISLNKNGAPPNEIGTWWAMAIPLITLPLVLHLRQEAPTQARRLGLHGAHLVWYIAFGVLTGVSLAASFVLTEMQFRFVAFDSLQQGSALPWSIWWTALVAGALAPAEELALRGKVLNSLLDGLNFSRARSVILVAVLSSIAWLPILLLLWTLPQALVMIAYRSILAVVNALWFLGKRSLIPGIMANFVFSVLIGWVLHP